MERRLIHLTTVPLSLRFLDRQVSFMRERGFDVHIVSSPGDMLTAFGHRESVITHAVKMRRHISPLQDLVALGKLIRLFKKLRPAIVHAHTPKAGLLGMLAAVLTRVPVRFYHIHGLAYSTSGGLRRVLLRRAEMLASACATRVLCVSHSIRQTAIDDQVTQEAKATVLMSGSINGVDGNGEFNPARFTLEARHAFRRRLGIHPSALVLGFVGRLVRDKGIIELIEAWRILKDRYHNAVLVIVGPTESGDPLPASVSKAITSDPTIICAGFVDEPAPYYAIIDVLALPTYREGFGLAIVEAGAFEVPVVASNVVGCVDSVADGKTGILVPPGDADALASAISRYFSDPILRSVHGRAGRVRVLNLFQPEAIWRAQLEEYLESLKLAGFEAAA
jgi:glycosyltransferase involved in cell wall biosynthesis